MGDNNMFYVFLAILFIAFIIITVTKKQKSPKSKGESGENAVSKILGDTIDGEKYVINDLLFETEPGKSCQIDHILINQRGIWVIETKNYAGKIYGQDNQREWIQTMAYGHEKNKFYTLYLVDDKEYELFNEKNEKMKNIKGIELENYVLEKKKEIDSLYASINIA